VPRVRHRGAPGAPFEAPPTLGRAGDRHVVEFGRTVADRGVDHRTHVVGIGDRGPEAVGGARLARTAPVPVAVVSVGGDPLVVAWSPRRRHLVKARTVV
jgi:hypothetical protein